MSSSPAPQILLIRHGETQWSRSGQHTGRTDIPLTERGQQQARALGRYLSNRTAQTGRTLRVFTSPLSRARETCRLSGLSGHAEIMDDLLEWNYGIYEGRTTLDIQSETPGWSIWESSISQGESLEQVGTRVKRVIEHVLALAPNKPSEDVALFAHGHVLRILASCWIGLPPIHGRSLGLDTATISALGYERQTRVIRHWNLAPAQFDHPAATLKEA